LLSWGLLIRKRTLARQGKSESFPAKLVGHLFEWSTSLAIVRLFYHLLLAFVAFGWRWITAEKLERLEDSLVALPRLAGEYKLTWGMSMAWLLVLYCFARWWIRFLDRETPFRAFKKVLPSRSCRANWLAPGPESKSTRPRSPAALRVRAGAVRR
jgi:hypothetical protein